MSDPLFEGAFVDTYVLIRHLTGDPPEQARRATKLLARTAAWDEVAGRRDEVAARAPLSGRQTAGPVPPPAHIR